jgi:predicted acyltransferase
MQMRLPAAEQRLASLDQFRGYTVLGMFLVNFVGSFQAIKEHLPLLGHHHTYCSYADTIMPQFFFAVGFAYRLTMLRRLATAGRARTYVRVLRRCLGLILIGFVVHHLDAGPKTWSELADLGVLGFLQTAFQRNFFQTLTHIGITSLWVLPVIAGGPWLRIGFAVCSGVTHVAISHAGYYDWVMARPGIDGGPLGFLTWTIPLLTGSLAYDLLQNNGSGSSSSSRTRQLLLAGLGAMLIGYGLSCVNRIESAAIQDAGLSPLELLVEPPFVPPSQPVDYWTMSQRAGSASYLTFAAGFSLAVFALFVWLCDSHGWELGLFRTLGSNALAAYILHDLVMDAVKPWVPKDAPLWYVAGTFALFLAICYVCVRYLEKKRLYLRL